MDALHHGGGHFHFDTDDFGGYDQDFHVINA